MDMLQVEKSYAHSRGFAKDGVCDDEMQKGFNLISHAFKSRLKSLEEDLGASNKERHALQEKVVQLHNKIRQLEREKVDSAILADRITEMKNTLSETKQSYEASLTESRLREQQAVADCKLLAGQLYHYRKRAESLEQMRRAVALYVKENEQENESCEFVLDKHLTSGHTTVNRTTIDYVDPQFDCSSDIVSSQCNSNNLNNTDTNCRVLFRLARSKLHPEKFRLFLDTVKKFNANDLTADEALVEAEHICGKFKKYYPVLGYERKGLYEQLKTVFKHVANNTEQQN